MLILGADKMSLGERDGGRQRGASGLSNLADSYVHFKMVGIRVRSDGETLKLCKRGYG